MMRENTHCVSRKVDKLPGWKSEGDWLGYLRDLVSGFSAGKMQRCGPAAVFGHVVDGPAGLRRGLGHQVDPFIF